MHPQPKPDELFSSWLVRLAFSNGFTLHTFYSKLLGYSGAIWNRDIDRHPSEELLSLLFSETMQAPDALRRMTLTKYEGVLYQELSENGVVPWVLPLGVFHRIHRHAGIQFCPLCLRADGYYRLPWRLALFVLCSEHRCCLEDSCRQCGSPVAFHRHGVGRDKLPHVSQLLLCQSCGFDLCRVEPRYPSWPDLSSLDLAWSLHGKIEGCPWAELLPRVSCPVPFFSGLRTLLGLLNGRFGARLRGAIAAEIGTREALPYSGCHFEFLEVQRRLSLLLHACWLLQNWPEHLVYACRKAGLSRSRIAEQPDQLPFWLEAALLDHLDNRTYSPTPCEIDAAAQFLVRRDGQATWQSLGQALGLQRDATKRALQHWLTR